MGPEHLLILYMALLFHTIVHELAHFIIVKTVLHIPALSVRIGSEVMSIEIGNWMVSPIPIGGYVEVEEEELIGCSTWKLILFFEIGCITNLIAGILFWLINLGTISAVFLLIGVILAVGNQIPYGSTDLAVLIKTAKKRSQ